MSLTDGQMKELLGTFWLENFVCEKHGLCVLCGNTGYVDTRNSAISPAGVRCGARVPCLCPNGRVFATPRSAQVAQSVQCGVPAGLPTLVVTASVSGCCASVVFGPLPKEPRQGQLTTIPINEEDGVRPLDELLGMLEAGTLKRRAT